MAVSGFMSLKTEKCFAGSLEHLFAELERIELKLQMRIERMRQENGEAGTDGFRGLYVSEESAASSLTGQPGETGQTGSDHVSIDSLADRLESLEQEVSARRQESLLLGQKLKLETLVNAFSLTRFETDALLVCLLPEIDRKYVQTYAFLQDDATKKGPTVDFILELLCDSLEEKIQAREMLAPEAPLVKYQLIRLLEDHAARPSSTTGKFVQTDERIVSFLLGDNLTDARLGTIAAVAGPPSRLSGLVLSDDTKARLEALAKNPEGRNTVFYFHGPAGSGRHVSAGAMCAEINVPLIDVYLDRLMSLDIPIETYLPLIFREGYLQDAAIYFHDYDKWLANEKAARLFDNCLSSEINRYPQWVFLSGEKDLQPQSALRKSVVDIIFPVPSYSQRRELWARFLGNGAGLPEGLNLSDLAGTFRLTGGQILGAIETTKNIAISRDPHQAQITAADIYAACRKQFRETLNTLAHKIKSRYVWADIVLPKDQMEQLHEICAYMKHYNTVYGDWGFGNKVSLGKGLNVLFAGPSGTGKTMAAEILSTELGLDLYKIDLSMIVSKYIGETEKNLDRIFTEGQTSNAILFFDEADALFGKRSEVRDSHDRYANVEVAYLLQKMEEYDGVVILATNFRKNMDEAFARRMHFAIEFPVPEEPDRKRIWQGVFPAAAPMDEKVDLIFMARQFKITGGNIKNIAVSAAFLAASDGGVITMEHLIRATKREYQKTGKLCTEGEFAEYFPMVRG